MKLVVSILALVAASLAAPSYEPVELNYHEAIGIPKAARIKAAEEASDFDGARIVGGSHARLGQFPSLGGLLITLQSGRTSVCGSSLLTNTRLVTAAHCWIEGRRPARTLTVVLGSIRLFSGGVRHNTNRVVAHPHYNEDTIANDVAVITIPHTAFTNNIRTISLASGGNLFVGVEAVAAGFGITRDGVGISENQVLSFVHLPVVTNAQCRNFFSARFIIDSTLCTWGPAGRNICSSDSGGPLQTGNTLIGIVSFGSGRCEANAPAAYARVTSFNAWIRQHL